MTGKSVRRVTRSYLDILYDRLARRGLPGDLKTVLTKLLDLPGDLRLVFDKPAAELSQASKEAQLRQFLL